MYGRALPQQFIRHTKRYIVSHYFEMITKIRTNVKISFTPDDSWRLKLSY